MVGSYFSDTASFLFQYIQAKQLAQACRLTSVLGLAQRTLNPADSCVGAATPCCAPFKLALLQLRDAECMYRIEGHVSMYFQCAGESFADSIARHVGFFGNLNLLQAACITTLHQASASCVALACPNTSNKWLTSYWLCL